jgi:hypothetical protein
MSLSDYAFYREKDRIVFRPWGQAGSAYLIPNVATCEKMRAQFRTLSITGEAIILLGGLDGIAALAGLGPGIFWPFLIILFLVWTIYYRLWAKQSIERFGLTGL